MNTTTQLELELELEAGARCEELPAVDRRHPDRRARVAGPTVCPHCDHERPGPHHLRDAGDLTTSAALAAGYCPELARLRNR